MKTVKKVMIFDDNEDLVKELKEILQDDNYDVSAFTDSKQSLSRVKDIMPDVVLLDLKMPGKSGFEVAEELQLDEQTKKIPILAISAYYKEHTGLLKAAGFRGCLTKPVDPEVLIKRLVEIIPS